MSTQSGANLPAESCESHLPQLPPSCVQHADLVSCLQVDCNCGWTLVFPHFSLHPHGEYSKPSVMCSRCHNIHSDGDRFQFCDGLWVCGCLVCKSHFQSQWPICVQANIPQKELAQLVRDAVRPLSGDLGPPAASKRVLHRAESSVHQTNRKSVLQQADKCASQ